MKKDDAAGVNYTPIKGMQLIKRVESEPKRKFIWGGIRENSMGIFAGAGKTGKTTFAENLAISIAVGRKEFFEGELDGIPRKVAFLNLEEDYSITGERLGDEIKVLSDTERDLFEENFYATPYDFPQFLNSEDDWITIHNYLKSIDASIIFIDSLSHLFVGEIEKSSSAQSMIQNFKKYIGSLNKTIIVIHHTTKGNESPISQDKVAGSRIISQEFNWGYGFAKIPTAEGGTYICHLFNKFQYADDNVAKLYKMDEYKWVHHLRSTNKFNLYKEVKLKKDARYDSTSEDKLYNYMLSQYSQGSQDISASQLNKEFVESSTMSKDTLYQNITKLVDSDKILRVQKGKYKIIEEESDGDRKKI